MSEKKPTVAGMEKVLKNAPKPKNPNEIKESPTDKRNKKIEAQDAKQTQKEAPEKKSLNVLMIAGITLFVVGILVIAMSMIINPKRRYVDFNIAYNQLIDEYKRKQVGTLQLEEDEYVYGYESIVNTPLEDALPPDLYVFFGFHEDNTSKSRFNYTGGNYKSSYTRINPKKYNNGILALDGAISLNMSDGELGSAPFLYERDHLPLTYDALVTNQKAMYNGEERTVYLRKSEQRQFKSGQTYFAIAEFYPTKATGVELDVTVRVHVRKRHDFTLF